MVKIIADTRIKINKKKIREAAEKYLQKINLPKYYLLNIIIVGRRKMRAISQRLKRKDSIHPVLTISYLKSKGPNIPDEETETDEKIAGEIFICYPQAVLVAAERERGVDETLSYLVEHGLNNIFE